MALSGPRQLQRRLSNGLKCEEPFIFKTSVCKQLRQWTRNLTSMGSSRFLLLYGRISLGIPKLPITPCLGPFKSKLLPPTSGP